MRKIRRERSRTIKIICVQFLTAEDSAVFFLRGYHPLYSHTGSSSQSCNMSNVKIVTITVGKADNEQC